MERDGGRVTREVLLPASREEVWEAITRPERLAEWFGGELELEAVPRGRVEHRAPDGSRRAGRVVSVDRPLRLVLWWADADEGEGEDVAGATGTRVEFVLLTHDDGTLLTVTESDAPSPLAMAG